VTEPPGRLGRPADRVLDLGERSWPVRPRGEAVEQLAHQIAAAVVEPLDFLGLVHRVVRGVLNTATIELEAR
jgi:hypothetical protein